MSTLVAFLIKLVVWVVLSLSLIPLYQKLGLDRLLTSIHNSTYWMWNPIPGPFVLSIILVYLLYHLDLEKYM